MRPAVHAARWAGQTFRSAVFLLLGGVILLPYVLLAIGFTQMYLDASIPGLVVTMLVVITAVIAALPPFLTTVRALEVAAARTFLDLDLPDPRPTTDAATRWRGAAFYGLYLLMGGAAMFALLAGVPVALAVGMRAVDPDNELFAGVGLGPLSSVRGVAAVLGSALIGMGVLLVLAVLGRLIALAASALLGPSVADRIAAIEDRARWLADRNRLARELHDSVGHALTVTTLQAAAARSRVESDPDFTVRALTAIEETGRSALADLDHALGLLREDQSGPITTAPTLAQLPRLWAEVRAGDAELSTEVDVDPAEVPAVVSTEAYRVVQEALTNALRHGAPGPVHVRIGQEAGTLVVTVANPLAQDRVAARAGGGHGLRGSADRAAVLGGELSAGPDADGARWVVQVRLPRGRRR